MMEKDDTRIVIPTAKLRWFPASEKIGGVHGTKHMAYYHGDEPYELFQWWEDIDTGEGEWRSIDVSNELLNPKDTKRR